MPSASPPEGIAANRSTYAVVQGRRDLEPPSLRSFTGASLRRLSAGLGTARRRLRFQPLAVSLQQRLEASWATRGPLAWLLLPLSLLFGCALALRRGLVLAGLLRSERLPVPVVVVGNLVVGGAGKTPAVIAVVALLRRQGWTPGIVSRGYGGSDRPLAVTRETAAHACGDEPLLLHLRTRAPVQVGRDRVAAGRELLRRQPEVNILVADDGLQHLHLARDAQLIVFDERGAGNGLLLPAGPLREPLARSAPPRSVVIYNAPAASTAWPGSLARRGLAGAVPLAAWWEGAAPSPGTLASLAGRPLLAVAGVARPGRFFAMLRERGVQIAELALPDHFAFDALPWPPGTPDVILTEKDAVKLPPQTPLGATRVWVATLDFGLDTASEAALCRLLPAPPGPHQE
jgi:tetraacyldisaccharide 4'-kinase